MKRESYIYQRIMDWISIKDTEEFYKLLTDEQIEFLSLTNSNFCSMRDSAWRYNMSMSGVADVIIWTDTKYYSHSRDSIISLIVKKIREDKIN